MKLESAFIDFKYKEFTVKDLTELGQRDKSKFYKIAEDSLLQFPHEIICNSNYNVIRIEEQLKEKYPNDARTVSEKLQAYKQHQQKQMNPEDYQGDIFPISLAFFNNEGLIAGLQLYGIKILYQKDDYKTIKAHPFPMFSKLHKFATEEWLAEVASLYAYLLVHPLRFEGGQRIELGLLDPNPIAAGITDSVFINWYSNELFGRMVLLSYIECLPVLKDKFEYCQFRALNGAD